MIPQEFGSKTIHLENTGSKQALRLFLLILFCLFDLLSSPDCSAQTINTANKQTRRYVRSRQEYACQQIQTPIELPGLPAYPGQIKFLMGTRSPNTKGGEYYTLHYSAKEEQKEVVAWYLQAAKNFHWTVDAREGEASSIMLSNNAGAICTIGVTNPSTPGYKSDIFLMYRGGKK